MTFDGRDGTRGARQPRGFFLKLANKMTMGRIRRSSSGNLLVLTTIGRQSGQERQSPVRWFGDGDGSRLIVASAAGAAKNPAWYYNLKADPERVWVEIGREKKAVAAEQLHGADYDEAWQRIAAEAPQFAGYREKTDRSIPVIRLSERP